MTFQVSVQGPAIPCRKKPTVELQVLGPKGSERTCLANEVMLSVLVAVPHWCLTRAHREQECWQCIAV